MAGAATISAIIIIATNNINFLNSYPLLTEDFHYARWIFSFHNRALAYNRGGPPRGSVPVAFG
jgi:hypothetical protein